MSSPKPRLLLKISGETLGGVDGSGIDASVLSRLSLEIKGLINEGFSIAVVVGGGNFIRGKDLEKSGIPRHRADQMGMLATQINAIALHETLKNQGVPTLIQSALEIRGVAQGIHIDQARDFLDQKGVVIFASGTGDPYFTTDTAAVLRAIEMGCSVLLKGTKVDGVFCSDPCKNDQAQFFTKISHDQVLAMGLGVMDRTAIALAQENHLKVRVFSILKPGMISMVAKETGQYTEIT